MKCISLMVLVTLIGIGCCCATTQPAPDYSRPHEPRKPDPKPVPRCKEVVIYDFYAEWCGPCKQFGPIFESWACKHSKPHVYFRRVDVDKEKEFAHKHGIHSIPTVAVEVDGVVIKVFVGACREEDILPWVAPCCCSGE